MPEQYEDNHKAHGGGDIRGRIGHRRGGPGEFSIIGPVGGPSFGAAEPGSALGASAGILAAGALGGPTASSCPITDLILSITTACRCADLSIVV